MTFAINSINQLFFTPKQVFFGLQTLFEALFSVFFTMENGKKVPLGGGMWGGATLHGKSHQKFSRLFLTLAFSNREHMHSHRLSV